MKTRGARRKKSAEPEVVELLISSDEEDDKKPPAQNQPAKRRHSIVELLSDSDEDEDFTSPKKRRRRSVSSDSDDAKPAARPRRASKATSRASSSSVAASRPKQRSSQADYDSDADLARRLQEEENENITAGQRGRKSRKLHNDEDLQFARQLQEKEDKAVRSRHGRKVHDADIEFARKLQEQEDEKSRKVQARRDKKDAELAATLHTQEKREQDERKQKEMQSMKESKAGRAVLLVEQVIKIVESHAEDGIDPVGKDDAVYLAERMLERQETFKTEGRPTQVCVGYHYTKTPNLDAIRTDGLLTVEDRIAAKNTNTRNIAVFGNGIYSGNNPLAFTAYGDVGLLIAAMKGNVKTVSINRVHAVDSDINTVVGNKTGDAPYSDEIILKSSAQVLPLVKYNQRNIYTQSFADKIWEIHQQIQRRLDEFFNGSVPTTVHRITSGFRLPLPAPPQPTAAARHALVFGAALPAVGIAAAAAPAMSSAYMPSFIASTTYNGSKQGYRFRAGDQGLGYYLDKTLTATAALSSYHGSLASTSFARSGFRASRRTVPSATRATARSTATVAPPGGIGSTAAAKLDLSGSNIAYKAPSTLAGSSNNTSLQPVAAGPGDCAICICPLADGSQVVKPPRCSHQFHRACIEASLKHDVKCPECRLPITASLAGKGPSGTMTVSNSSATVSGFPRQGCITITYVLEGGVQKSYHQNPGVRYSGTSRVAYLPNNQQGQDLLKRLKYAFAHGLSFSIGTSLTTHQPNVITWGAVHHKTGISGGGHGFPDPNYFNNANSELDGLGVPPAASI